jgi:acyl-CoA thioesterase I
VLQMGPVPLRLKATLAAACMLALAAGPAVATDGDGCRITALGDSLVAGYGLRLEDSFPAQLERALAAEGFACEVINAGVPGDTSAGGLARLDWTLADRPSHAIVELGANDGLRALPVEQMEANLDAILTRLAEEGVPALLAGMLAPPNLGRDYGDAFAAVFERLALRHEVAFYPFFLDGVAGDPALAIEDGVHPSAEGVAIVVRRMLPVITAWLEATGGQ